MPANVGNQTVSIIYFAPGQSSIVNRRHKSIRMLGIYSGGYVSFTPGINNVNISPLVCEITDGTHQVRVQTTSTVNIAVTSVNLYVVLRWNYTGSTSDYMEILAVSTPATNDLIVGKCSFSGSPPTLQGFSYEERTTPNTQDLFLKVEPTGETELRVRIRAGRIQTASADIDIVDQKSNLFTLPSANSKVYLVYIDMSTGAIAIDSSGTEAVNPVPPNYKGKLVLAEVTLSSTDTSITKDKIKDVRSFISLPILSGDGIYVTTDVNGKLTLVGYSVDKTKVSRYLPAQILPGWYVKYHAEAKTKPGDFTYGDPSGKYISFGQIVGVLGYQTGGSFLFEMKVYNASGSLKTVTQKLRWIDDNVYFYLNNPSTPFKAVVGAGSKNEDINWNLSVGENTLQIVINNATVQNIIFLLGDIVNDTNVYFVGPVS